MSTSTVTAPARTSDSTWLQLLQLSLAVGMVTLVVFAVVGTFYTTISGGDFRYTADYWYTGVGLPLTLMGVGHTLGVHKLQHGADGRLGTIGLWVNTLAMIELFAQLLASVVEGTEVRWGAAYPVFTLISFIGMSLLAAGSWRTGLLPKWMLGVWPVVWIIGGLAAQGPTPVLLCVFFLAFGIMLTRRVRSRAAASEPLLPAASAA
jgi:hypothetical protein